MDPVVNPVMARLVEATHALAALQGEAGEIPAPHRDVAGGVEEAATLAARLARACGQPDYAAALERDARGWIEAGLDTPPDFGASRDALRLPEQNEPFLFWGPLRLANGDGGATASSASCASATSPRAWRRSTNASPIRRTSASRRTSSTGRPG